jgi:pyridoxal phosphate enzyme (YggS family)
VTRELEIAQNLAKVRERIAKAAASSDRNLEEITLIAVTKNFPVSDAQILYELGIRDMGENRDEEGARKSEQLPADISWHFQGQIQSRKIKSIASWADVVHSLDSLSHAEKFAALVEGKPMEFFLQINLEPEREDRGGIAPNALEEFMDQLKIKTEIVPIGVMTVAPIDQDPTRSFLKLAQLGKVAKVSKLSMGMSGDFEAAIAAGATHIRVGSSILGSRGYRA